MRRESFHPVSIRSTALDKLGLEQRKGGGRGRLAMWFQENFGVHGVELCGRHVDDKTFYSCSGLEKEGKLHE